MNEQLPLEAADAPFELVLEDGWKEILDSPDDDTHKLWFTDLVALTQARMQNLNPDTQWAGDVQEVTRRWQVAIELLANASLDLESQETQTSTDVIKDALLVFKMNRKSMGWEEEGLAFNVPNILTGEIKLIDLRSLPAGRGEND